MGLIESGGAYIAHTVYRLIQMIMAITVIALYGMDLHRAHRENKYTDSKWAYAVAVSSMAAVTALAYCVPFVRRIPFLFVWDTILFFFWIVLFGVFGKLYIGTRADDWGIQRMKSAVWVDLVNALLWLVSAIGMVVYWAKHRNNKTRFTGRATV